MGVPNMGPVVKRLEASTSHIKEIMSIAGTAGLSLGVLHHGEVIYKANLGYRDVEGKKPVDEKTVFPICSLTKALTSAVLGQLVEEGKITWDTPVKSILPDFHTKSEILQNLTTVVDVLAMRMGMQTTNIWHGAQNNLWFPEEDGMKVINELKLVRQFRGEWAYNNWGYEIAGRIIEKLTGESFGKRLASGVLQPLGLRRTGTHMGVGGDDNVANGYGTLDDGTPVLLEPVKLEDGTIMNAAGGGRSCVTDLLVLYHSLLKASAHQFKTGLTSTPGSPFKQVRNLFHTYMPLPNISLRETSYALGWARTQLPGPMGAVGLNPKLMANNMPDIGSGSPPRLVLYHQGSLAGALSAVNLFPETQSAIVILTNSLALNDCPDWIAQMLTEALFDDREGHDFAKLAQTSADAAHMWYSTLEKDLQAKQTVGTSPKELEEYVGRYYNQSRTMFIEVSRAADGLQMCFQGIASEVYDLHHYQYDTFSWLAPRNDLARRGRFTHQTSSYYLLHFDTKGSNRVNRVYWAHDSKVPEGEGFFREQVV